MSSTQQNQQSQQNQAHAWWETFPSEVTIHFGFGEVYDSETGERLGTLEEPNILAKQIMEDHQQQEEEKAGTSSSDDDDYWDDLHDRDVDAYIDAQEEAAEREAGDSILVEVGGACDLPGGGFGLVVNDGQGLLLPDGQGCFYLLSEEEVQALFAALQQQQDQDTGLGLSDRVRGGSEEEDKDRKFKQECAFLRKKHGNSLWRLVEGREECAHDQALKAEEQWHDELRREDMPEEVEREIMQFEREEDKEDTGLGLSDRVRGGSEEEDTGQGHLECSICKHVFDDFDDVRACAHPRCHNRVCVDCRVGVVGQLGRFCLPGFHSYEAGVAGSEQGGMEISATERARLLAKYDDVTLPPVNPLAVKFRSIQEDYGRTMKPDDYDTDDYDEDDLCFCNYCDRSDVCETAEGVGRGDVFEEDDWICRRCVEFLVCAGLPNNPYQESLSGDERKEQENIEWLAASGFQKPGHKTASEDDSSEEEEEECSLCGLSVDLSSNGGRPGFQCSGCDIHFCEDCKTNILDESICQNCADDDIIQDHIDQQLYGWEELSVPYTGKATTTEDQDTGLGLSDRVRGGSEEEEVEELVINERGIWEGAVSSEEEDDPDSVKVYHAGHWSFTECEACGTFKTFRTAQESRDWWATTDWVGTGGGVNYCGACDGGAFEAEMDRQWKLRRAWDFCYECSKKPQTEHLFENCFEVELCRNYDVHGKEMIPSDHKSVRGQWVPTGEEPYPRERICACPACNKTCWKCSAIAHGIDPDTLPTQPTAKPERSATRFDDLIKEE